MNTDIYIDLLDHLDIEDLKSYCSQNRFFRDICLGNRERISKNMLERYSVKYNDPTNFIYVMSKTKMSDYRTGERWKYSSLFKLYMKYYNQLVFDCDGEGITSFPIYPKMTEFYGMDNELTSFPVQPKMVRFVGESNRLTSFPVQPDIVEFFGDGNQLTSFPVQPKMTIFDGQRNQLTSFPVQPEMTYFDGDDNNLESFPVQPKMTMFSGKANSFKSFPEQPRMVECHL